MKMEKICFSEVVAAAGFDTRTWWYSIPGSNNQSPGGPLPDKSWESMGVCPSGRLCLGYAA